MRTLYMREDLRRREYQIEKKRFGGHQLQGTPYSATLKRYRIRNPLDWECGNEDIR